MTTENATGGPIPETSMRLRGWETRPPEDERGFILVWCGLIITVLLGFAGFAVDLGNWYLHIQHAQRAADSAALDGATHLPADPDTATAVAKEGLKNNGVEQQFIDAAVIKVVNGHPNQLYVKVDTQTNNSFVKMFGVGRTSTFTRAATATWAPPIEMGNFSNVLGTEPADPSRPLNDQWETAAKKAAQRQYWLTIAGPDTFQGRGDEYTGRKCDNPRNGGNVVDGCKTVGLGGQSTSFIPPPPGSKYAKAQYSYTVTVLAGAPGVSTRLQVYDPAFALTGPYCKPPFWRGGNTADLFADTGNIHYDPNRPDFCAGDHQYSDTYGDDSTVYKMPTTYFRVYDDKGNPMPSCPATRSFAPWGPPVGSDYHSSNGLVPYENNASFKSVFHEWVTLCDVPYDKTKDNVYKVQVWTDSGSEGMNHFALRSGLINGGAVNQAASSQYIRFSADKHLSLYSNRLGADMRFAIAEVPQSLAGTDVRFAAFDIGDCNNCTLTNSATFQLESDSKSPSSPGQKSTRSCDVTPIKNLNTTVAMPNCKLSNVWNGAGYNGKKVWVTWHVPSDYTCGPSNGTSCFLFMHIKFAGGSTQVDDISTWSLDGDGIPLRLIKNPNSP